MTTSVQNRQRVERQIARATLRNAVAAGFDKFEVDNGDDENTSTHTSVRGTLDAMFQTDEDRVFLWKGEKQVGWVYFVYGNDGWDVISDYTTNLEHIIPQKLIGSLSR